MLLLNDYSLKPLTYAIYSLLSILWTINKKIFHYINPYFIARFTTADILATSNFSIRFLR